MKISKNDFAITDLNKSLFFNLDKDIFNYKNGDKNKKYALFFNEFFFLTTQCSSSPQCTYIFKRCIVFFLNPFLRVLGVSDGRVALSVLFVEAWRVGG